MDPVTVLMTMAMATTHLGLGATYSTSYYEPFHVARVFATVDLMSEGRAAGNVVTSVNDNEARNMGREEHPAHEARYDLANEFIEVVLGHWTSWDDDAIVLDKERRVFADPAKVRRLDYRGEHYRSRGPFSVPGSRRGVPVVIQAGQSARGRNFAARWGELIFAGYGTIENGREQYAALKAAAAAYGRDPDQMKITSLAYPVVAEMRAEALEKKAAYDELPNEIDQLSLLSEALNSDFASKPPDEPFSDDELEGLQGMQTIRDGVLCRSGIKNPTVQDFVRVSGRGRVNDAWVGSATDIADQLEAWFTSVPNTPAPRFAITSACASPSSAASWRARPATSRAPLPAPAGSRPVAREVAVVVVRAARVEAASAARALRLAGEVAGDAEHEATAAAEHGPRVALVAPPDLDRVVAGRVVAVGAGHPQAAAAHAERDDVSRAVPVATAGLRVDVEARDRPTMHLATARSGSGAPPGGSARAAGRALAQRALDRQVELAQVAPFGERRPPAVARRPIAPAGRCARCLTIRMSLRISHACPLAPRIRNRAPRQLYSCRCRGPCQWPSHLFCK